MTCRFDPCDEPATFTVCVEGEDPVALCWKHSQEYGAWIIKNKPDLMFRREKI